MAILKVDSVNGLVTAPNELNIPDGSLLKADNCVIRTPGVIEPRRGYSEVTSFTGSFNTYVTSLAFWKDNIVFWQKPDPGNTGILFKYDGTTASQLGFGGTGGVDQPSGTYRLRFYTANQNLYYPSTNGIRYRDTTTLAGESGATRAGFTQPADIRATLYTNTPDAAGSWLPEDSAVAYRVVYGVYDANKNFKLSAPSGRVVVQNRPDVAATVAFTNTVTTRTVTTASAHYLSVGDVIAIADSSNTGQVPNGNITIVTVPTATSFTYSAAAAVGTGTATATLSSGSRYPTIRIPIADNSITTTNGMFYRVYRTEATDSATTDPGDEMFLVYEAYFSSTDVSTNSYASYDDKVSTITQAVPLYTNPNNGGGIGIAKSLPPYALDGCSWASRAWLANTKQVHSTTIKLLGVGSPDGFQSGDYFYFPGGRYIFDGNQLYTPTQNIQNAVNNIVYKVNSFRADSARSTEVPDVAGYALSDTLPTGEFKLARTQFSPASSSLYTTTKFPWYSSRTTCWAPTPTIAATLGSITSGNIIVAGGPGSIKAFTVNGTTHGLSVGDFIVVMADTTFTTNTLYAGVYHVDSVGSSTSFTFRGLTNSATGSSTANVTINKLSTNNASAANVSDDNQQIAGLSYSELAEPESFPDQNFLVIGDPSFEILRIFPQEDRLLVFKEDGLYVVTGGEPFRVDLFDQTCVLVAPDSVVSMNNQVYALTTKGVVRIDGGGVQVISKAIDPEIRKLLTSTMLPYTSTLTFGVSYESEMEYALWVPVSGGSTTRCDQTYVFNANTGAWTRWTLPATGGYCSPSFFTKGERLYVGTDYYDNLRGKLFEERKALTGADYSDYDFTVTISSVTGTSITLASASGVSVGDSILGPSSNGYGLITAVNTNTLTVVLDANQGTFTTGSATVYKAIPVDLVFTSAFAGEPAFLKHYRDATALLRSKRFYSANLKFYNGWDETNRTTSIYFSDRAVTYTYDTTTRKPPANKRVLVPKELQQCAYLNVGFTLTEARAYFALNGYTLTFEPGSERNSR